MILLENCLFKLTITYSLFSTIWRFSIQLTLKSYNKSYWLDSNRISLLFEAYSTNCAATAGKLLILPKSDWSYCNGKLVKCFCAVSYSATLLESR